MMNEREVHRLPDGELVVPFSQEDKISDVDNPYKIDPSTSVTTTEEI